LFALNSYSYNVDYSRGYKEGYEKNRPLPHCDNDDSGPCNWRRRL